MMSCRNVWQYIGPDILQNGGLNHEMFNRDHGATLKVGGGGGGAD